MTPKYNVKEIALYLAKEENIPLVLGSATPDISTYYKLEKQNAVITLTERANSAELPKIEIIDMKQELAMRKQINA